MINFETKHYIGLTTLFCFGPGLVPVLTYYFDIVSPERHFFAVFPVSYIVLFLMGDFMENKLPKKYYCKKGVISAWIILTLVLIASLILSIYQMNMNGRIDNNDIYGTIYYTPTVVLSMCIYYLAKYYIINSTTTWISRCIMQMGSCTLGIYLLGDFLRDYFEFISDFLKERMSQFISVLLYDIAVFGIGMAIVLFYHFIKKYIYRMIRE